MNTPADPPSVADEVDGIQAAWQRERPDLDFSSVGVITRLWRIARHLEQMRAGRLEELGTDRITLDVLAELRRSGAPYRLTAGDLRKASMITAGGMSQRLEKLERAGLVSRRMSADDRRVVEVQLTGAGIELLDAVVADLMARESQVLRGLAPDELDALNVMLRRLLAVVEDPRTSAPSCEG